MSGRNEAAGSAPTPSLSTRILSSQGSRLSELRGREHARLSCLPAFTLAVFAPRKACSVTLQSPSPRPLLLEAPLDFLFA